MRILYATNLYPPGVGGAQIHLHRLAQTIQSFGHDVQVVTHTCRYRRDWLRLSTIRTEKDRRFLYEGVPVWQMGFSMATRARLLPWALGYYGMIEHATRNIAFEGRRLLDQYAETPDLAHASRNGREFICRAALDYAHRRNVPFVLTPNHHPLWKGWRYTEYDKIYREADALVVLTEAEKREMVEEKRVREDKVHVTGVGPVLSTSYDAAGFRARFSLPEHFVLYLGQQLRYKGVGALLESTSEVWKRHPHAHFVFIGPTTPYSERIFASIKDRRIHNLGAVDLETKTSALAACEFLCLPSAQESFGGVYTEAWAMRKAVIGSRIPATSALIEEGHDGLLSSQDPSELANAVSYLLSEPAICERMGTAGFNKVQANYSWDRIGAKTLDIYLQLLGHEVTAGRDEDHAVALTNSEAKEYRKK